MTCDTRAVIPSQDGIAMARGFLMPRSAQALRIPFSP